ncbi:MAG: hypothetical protein R3C03_17385 [Pirellulaceae bacterium]
MPKLNQIIAIQASKKSTAKETLTDIYQQVQKPDLLTGISRSYKPKDELGEELPAETKLIQLNVNAAIERAEKALVEMFDVVATQDWANCEAKSDIVVDNQTIVAQVPVTHLLFLEKQLVDLHTFVSKLPVLDPAERWNYDSSQDCFAADPFQSLRTKKVPKTHIKYEATKEHPAQVEMYMEDVTVGTWTTVKYSGAIPAARRNSMLERVTALQDAVKSARENANSLEVERKKIGQVILDFVFRDSRNG